MEDLFSDLMIGILNAANTAVQNRQLNTLASQIAAIQTEIDSLDFQIADWESQGRSDIAQNLIISRDILNEYLLIEKLLLK